MTKIIHFRRRVIDDIPHISLNSWAPSAWKFLNAVAYSYPVKPDIAERQKMHRFLVSLSDVLPCSLCRRHFQKAVSGEALTDDDLSSRNKLVAWLNRTHNEVNQRLGKQQISIEQMRNLCFEGRLEQSYFTCDINQLKNFIILLSIILLFFLWIKSKARR